MKTKLGYRFDIKSDPRLAPSSYLSRAETQGQ